jgi:hypothetical protein
MFRHDSGVSRLLAATVAALLSLVLAMVAAGSAAAVAAASPEGVSAANGTVAKNAQGKMKSTVIGKTAGGGKLGGTFTPLKFKNVDGVPMVRGVLDGVITHGDGSTSKFTAIRSLEVRKINGHKLADATVSAGQLSQPVCRILTLVLGPLDLNVLGLRVQLNRVELRITAIPGPGNLLGNLLCAIAGLLDGGLGGLLGQLIDLLNEILDALGLGI